MSEVLAEALEDITAHVPFNNFSSILFVAIGKVPAGIGGSCLYHARLGSQYFEDDPNWNAQILCGYGKPHFANLVHGTNGELYYFDSSLHQVDPLDINQALRSGKAVEARAYPIIGGEWSKLVLEFYNDDVFLVSRHLPFIRKEDDPDWSCDFVLSSGKDSLPDDTEMWNAIVRRKTLALRMVMENGDTGLVRHDLETGARGFQCNGGDYGSKNIKEGDPDFDEVAEAITRRVGIEVSQIFQLLEKTAELYKGLTQY